MSPMLPFIEVNHLPSSSSLYSAATQPLGLRFISADNSSGSPSITYGTVTSPPVPVFELRQVQPAAGRPLKLSRVAFAATSREAVAEFQAIVRRIKEEDHKSAQFGDQSLLRHPEDLQEPSAGKPRTGTGSAKLPDIVRETDIDGNIMEVAYVPPAEYPERYGGSTVRKTQSTQSEVSRILNWNYDVASAEPVHEVSLTPLAPASSNLVSPRRPGRLPDDEQASAPRRSTTHTSTTLYEAPGPNSNSLLNPGGMMGALMGVAAGAAIGAGITYGVMRGGSEASEAPTLQRNSTLPEPSHDSRNRYPEYDRPAKELQHRDDYTLVADRRPPPTILTRYTHAPAPLGRSREVDDVYEGRSRHSSRSKPPGLTSMRSRSEISTSRKPLLLTDTEHRGYVSSKHGDAEDLAQDHRGHASLRHSSRSKYSPAEPQSMRRSLTYHVGAGGDTYGPVHGQRTASTSRGPPIAGGQAELAPRVAPKTTARAAASTSQDKPRRSNSYKSARDVPLPVSRAASYVSPRDVPLPASRSGGMSYVSPRHVPLPPSNSTGVPRTEKWEDDLDSIAPSDSISCVGNRRNQRLYR